MARHDLAATELLNFFGCVDLMQNAHGEWLVLEVGTDGIYNIIDREIDLGKLAQEINERVARAFWNWIES